MCSQSYSVRNELTDPTDAYSLHEDSWLAAIFGRPVWQVDAKGGGDRLSALKIAGSVFAYAKCEASRVDEVVALSNFGFRVVEMSLTLDGLVSAGSWSRSVSVGQAIRYANLRDRDTVCDLATRAFRFSRFHLDPQVPIGLADRIKGLWARNYFSGERGDGMVVAESDGQVVGFLQLLWGQHDTLIIDLIGVAPESQGRGLGRAMICHAALNGTGDNRRPTKILVGTQAANSPSMRLYESLGLRVRSAKYVLHYHGEDPGFKR
jgi:ribosomal protein S18 acetylase RimI-like enzyme